MASLVSLSLSMASLVSLSLSVACPRAAFFFPLTSPPPPPPPLQVEIVFPVAPKSISTAKQELMGGAQLQLPSGLAVVPGKGGGRVGGSVE